MNQYRIAELLVSMDCKYEIMQKRSEKYLTDISGTPDITIEISDELISQKADCWKNLSLAEIELVLMTSRFGRQLLKHQGFLLHASAIAFQGKGILFSADSGVGKSTHTRLWQQYFGKNNVPIVNDDKPALRFTDNQIFVHGNPFSGNSDENLQMKVPLHAIVFLKRDTADSIRPLTVEEAIPYILRQTPTYQKTPEVMDTLLSFFHLLLSSVPVYLLNCTPNESAVILTAQTLFDTSYTL